MSGRLNLSATSVLPFQFPSLAATSETEAEVGDPQDLGANGLGEDAATAIGSEQDGARPREITAQSDKAYAEGFERGLQDGREKGYAAGHAAGVEAGRATLAEEARRLAAIVARLGGPLAALEQPVEDAVVALGLEVARCVIGAEIARSHEFLVRLVREAVAKIPIEMGTPQVLLNPVDLGLIRELVPEAEAGNAILVGNEAVEAGGCLVVAGGEISLSKDRRWDPRASGGVSQVDLTLPSRWRALMLTLFDGEDG